MTRRELMKQAASFAAFAALARRGDAEVAEVAVAPRGTARACVFVNLAGAPSHLDTFDVKDAAWNPADIDIRQYGAITLSNRLFPNLSKLANDLCLLRSVKSWEAAHERGQFYLQTAHPSNPAFVAETPHIGAVISLEKGSSGPMPPFLSLNAMGEQGSTFLGGRVAPMRAPANRGGLNTIEHNFYGSDSQNRFEQRYQFLSELDAQLRSAPLSTAMGDHAAFYDAARQLMYNQAIAAVFRFTEEEELRYGNTNLGRAALVARNAIQAKNGVVFITLTHNGWDTHQSMFDPRYMPNMYSLCNELDTAIGALAADLKASGDLSQTLIVMMGEFGRTPGPLNARGGRDHHRDAMAVAMLGGGVRGGRVIGATDRNGAQVIDPGWRKPRAIVVEDLVATIYSAMGINWTKSITDTPTGRRFEYVPYADLGTYTAIEEVFG
jgi:uncharacterized protein (DUF1501 family)